MKSFLCEEGEEEKPHYNKRNAEEANLYKRMGGGVYCYGPQCTHSEIEWGRRVAHYVTKWDRTEVALDERCRARWQGESSLLGVKVAGL